MRFSNIFGQIKFLQLYRGERDTETALLHHSCHGAFEQGTESVLLAKMTIAENNYSVLSQN